jgi:glycosyltransferase involved in cell wall biosynthesis
MIGTPLPSAPQKKLIILDPSLKNMGGHFYEYDAAIAEAALRRAMPTWIYVHKSCDGGLTILGGEIHPWFSAEWSAAGGRARTAVRHLLRKLPTALRAPLARIGRRVWNQVKKRRRKPVTTGTATLSDAARLFENEVAAALRHARCSSDDIIFLPTIRTSELFALWKAVQRTSDFHFLQFHIVLRRDASEMDFPEDGAPGISVMFREIQGAPAGKTFRFYCDTAQLCADYTSLTDDLLEFRLLPIPFPDPNYDPTSLQKWSAGPAIKLVYLGGARVEKGFHLISGAMRFLQKAYPGKILWRLQAPLSGGLEEPEVIEARREMTSVRDGSIELVERNLTSAEFQSLLLSADIVLLPYLREFYRARSSGILVQVLAAGKPVIVPSGTWLSSQTNETGAVEFAGPSDFPDAVLHAVRQLPGLTREARARAAAYAAFHNADALLEMLERDPRQAGN